MAGAVVVAEAVDGLGEDLDLPRRGRQRVGLGVRAEVLQQDGRPRRVRQLESLLLPEGLEVRQLEAGLGGALARLVPEMPDPVHLVEIGRASCRERVCQYV